MDLAGRGSLYVREIGGPAGAPTVVLLHGAAVSGALNWWPAYEPLARYVNVISPDQRGHGRSFHSHRRFRLEDAADDVVALADVLELDRFIPIGYSMGGAIAQLVWRRHPDRVSAMVLCATWARYFRNHRERGFLRTVGQLGTGSRVLTRRRAVDVFLAAAEKHSSVGRRDAWQVAEVRSGSVPMMIEALGTVGSFDSSAWVGSIDVPLGLIVLDRDDIVAPDRQHHLASLVPDADVRHLDLRHDECISRPEIFTPALTDLVRGVTGASSGS